MRLLRCIVALSLAGWLYACSIPPPLLEQIKMDGVLKVGTFKMATTVFEGPDGWAGFEHDLVELFAEHLGVEVEYTMVDNFGDLLPLVRQRKVHFAAANLTVTPERQRLVKFGPPYLKITQQVIFHMGPDNQRPKKIEDLYGKILEITADTSYEEELKKLKKNYPDLEWTTHNDLQPMDLLDLVNRDLIDYTITDSHYFSVVRRYFPDLAYAFDLTSPEELAWAFPHSNDDSLYNEMVAFFKSIKDQGLLDQLIERYFGHIKQLNFVDLITFKRDYIQRLPEYRDIFLQASEQSGIDWRLLAAIGYQESHWDPEAVSPTGVKGLMMLTGETAKVVGVKDRTDPVESIIGGSIFFSNLVKKYIPKHIPEPDRTWFALAGYNVGFGHVEDARMLARRAKENPDKWIVVKKYLPLLSLEKWYSKTKHGFARGWEPVTYVDNIRDYFDLLVRILDEEEKEKEAFLPRPPEFSPPAAL